MAVQYDKPSRINLVSILFFLALAAGIYSLLKFGPPYYRRWKASGVVSEMLNKLYGERLRGDQAVEGVRKEMLDRLRDLGIDETTAQIQLQRAPDMARVSVTYREVVKHLFVNKTSTLEFSLSEETRREKND